MRVYSYLLLLTALLYAKVNIMMAQGNSLTFSPSTPLCIGETVQLICYVVPPTAQQFIDDAALMSFNDSAAATINSINNNLAGVDTDRYTADITGLTVSTDRPGIRLTITDYQASDGATNFSCHGLYSTSAGGPSPAIISEFPQRLASASFPFDVTLSQPIDSCSTVLMWSTPSSDRPITSYSVYRDGVSIEPNLSSTTTQYTDSDQIDVTAVHTYYVVASSCAGDNTSNVVSSVSIGVPSSPLVTLSQTDISCSNTLISWPTPSSDRSITSYSVYRDGTFLSNTTTNQYTDNTQLNISTVYEYSVVAVSCSGISIAGVKSVMLEFVISLFFVSYDTTSGETLLSWVFSTDTSLQLVHSLSYFLMFDYTHSQGNETDPSDSLSDSFSQNSTVTSYNITKNIEPPTFSGEGKIDTVIRVCIQITEQCGQNVTETMMACNSSDSVIPNPTVIPQFSWLFVGIGVVVFCLCCGCVLIVTGSTILIIFCCVSKKKGKEYSMFNSRKKSDSHELDEQTYSQINKANKGSKNQPPVEEKKMEGLYADINHEFPKPDSLKKPEPIEETLYSKVHSIDGPSY